MNQDITRLQAYLRASAISNYRQFPVPPFTVFIQPNDSLTFFNYAIPDAPIAADDSEARESLELLKAVFQRENRRPRFEFLAEYAPDLPTLLESADFVQESRLPLLLCTPQQLEIPAPMPGLRVEKLTADSSRDTMIAHSRIAFIGFGMGDTWQTEFEAGIPEEKARAAEKGTGQFVGYLHDEPVVVATYGIPHDGITEIGGVATLPAYRRRGLAGYITAYATREAFASGVTLALLSAGDEGAARVYERVGYRTGATALAYWTEEPERTESE